MPCAGICDIIHNTPANMSESARVSWGVYERVFLGKRDRKSDVLESRSKVLSVYSPPVVNIVIRRL